MKRLFIFITLFTIVAIAAQADVQVNLLGGLKLSEGAAVKDTYGNNILFGAGFDIFLSDSFSLSGEYLLDSDSAKTFVTKENLDITIHHIHLGGKYYAFESSGIFFGAGGSFLSLEEKTPFGSFDDTGFGFYLETGINFSIFLLKAQYEFAEIGDENAGGFSVLAGASFEL
jgi:opacity protein-like surface antigen